MKNIIKPCGGCTACCAVFGVREIDKEPWTVCEHLVAKKGCKIYGKRPHMCREFFCLWQSVEHMTEEERPDRLGAIFATTNGPTEFTGAEEIQAYELRPGSMDDSKVMRVAKRLSAESGKLIVAHLHGGKALQFFGPQAKIDAAMEWAALPEIDMAESVRKASKQLQNGTLPKLRAVWTSYNKDKGV